MDPTAGIAHSTFANFHTDSSSIKNWVDVAKSLVTIGATLLGGFWAWSKFVLERGLMPPSQMGISLQILGSPKAETLLDFSVDIHNKGSSALVVTDLRIRLRYLTDEDEVLLIDDPDSAACGRVNFPHVPYPRQNLPTRKEKRTALPASSPLAKGEFMIVPYDTFVQPGVEQRYSFATSLPAKASFVLARASFRYELRPSETQKKILRLSRKLGLIQYSLSNIDKPHTFEKAFALQAHDLRNIAPHPIV